MEGGREEGFALTVAAFQEQASRNSIDHRQANDVAAIILHETLELLDLLSHGAPDVALPFGIHIHVRPPDTEEPERESVRRAGIRNPELKQNRLFASADVSSLRPAEAADTEDE